jgi:hypothetical protein
MFQACKHKISPCDLQKVPALGRCKIFASLFENKFVPSVRCHLHSKKLEGKAFSLLDHCPAHPSAYVLKMKDGKIKAMFLPKSITALIQPMDQCIIQACKSYRSSELLGRAVDSEQQVAEFLKTLMLLNATYSVGLAWRKITLTTTANCWKKCTRKDYVIADETQLIPFSKQNMKAACNVLSPNLKADDLVSWIPVDEETL